MVAIPIYSEFIDFLASGVTPKEIIEYKPSDELKEKVYALVQKEKDGQLTKREASELNYYFHLEHIFRLAKIKARKYG